MDNEIIIEEETKDADVAQKYIDEINKLKQNTVSKDNYEKLKEENTALFKALMEGGSIDSSPEEDAPTIEELREKLYGENSASLSDVEYVKSMCDLRDLLLEKEGIDYFVPPGAQYSPDQNDLAAAEKVYQGFRHCIEVADGDDSIFHAELSRITNDSGLKNIRKR